MGSSQKDSIMTKERKRRIAPRDAKRLRTLRRRKSREAIRADAQKAGRMAGTHFTSESSQAANDKRWAAHRAAKAAKLAAEQKGE